ncbi:hypothetical protein RISK_005194 [Rhodopirellula islandica]|uniref:Uncharacterized protein n=1 Tax=Rhodopirellula islandica TaxID=595434 RepID=A0A0J1B8N2_RHOIS|nr:hypothetical protein [Rhodopirellula islandica]KLU02898.1 hypothetical protein RISK_005194 [Rhodopirellula islandica]
MNLNFFDWLRDGVRQSVILGVSDAVEQIGTPDETSEINPQVAALLQEPTADKQALPAKKGARPTGRKAAPRKRLGKSLQELNPPSK